MARSKEATVRGGSMHTLLRNAIMEGETITVTVGDEAVEFYPVHLADAWHGFTVELRPVRGAYRVRVGVRDGD